MTRVVEENQTSLSVAGDMDVLDPAGTWYWKAVSSTWLDVWFHDEPDGVGVVLWLAVQLTTEHTPGRFLPGLRPRPGQPQLAAVVIVGYMYSQNRLPAKSWRTELWCHKLSSPAWATLSPSIAIHDGDEGGLGTSPAPQFPWLGSGVT